jgi:hypothetical protein
VTADALHTSRAMAQAIIDRGGDYCLALKGNQNALLSDARATLAKAGSKTPTAESSEKGHGRAEKRRAIVVKAPVLPSIISLPDLRPSAVSKRRARLTARSKLRFASTRSRSCQSPPNYCALRARTGKSRMGYIGN